MRISLSSGKGGVGKSTTCINLAALFVADNKTVTLVDCDPQGSVNDWVSVRPDGDPAPFTVVAAPRKTISQDIEQIQKGYDIAILDTPPRSGAIAIGCMAAADIVLIPVAGSSFDAWAAEGTIADLERVKAIRPEIKVALFLNRVVRGSSISREMLPVLKDLDATLFSSVVHQRVAIARTADGHSILQSSDDKAIREYKSLYRELIKFAND